MSASRRIGETPSTGDDDRRGATRRRPGRRCGPRSRRSASPGPWRTSWPPRRRPGSTGWRSSSPISWCRSSSAADVRRRCATWACRSTSTSRSGTSTPPIPSSSRSTCAGPTASSTSWSSWAPTCPGLLGGLPRRRRRQRGRSPNSCTSWPPGPTERGMRISYEALAWGTHVNTYERSWDIVRAADHPALGMCLDSFHILSRGSDPAGIEAIPGEKLFFLQLADAPFDGHGRPAVEPALPAVSRAGRLRPAGVPRPRADRRVHRAAVARGVQRCVPAVGPGPGGRGRAPFAAGPARIDGGQRAARPGRVGRSGVRIDGHGRSGSGPQVPARPSSVVRVRRTGRRRGQRPGRGRDAGLAGLRARRAAPHQAGAAVVTGRCAGAAERGHRVRRAPDTGRRWRPSGSRPRTRRRPRSRAQAMLAPLLPRRRRRRRGGPVRGGRTRRDVGLLLPDRRGRRVRAGSATSRPGARCGRGRIRGRAGSTTSR